MRRGDARRSTTLGAGAVLAGLFAAAAVLAPVLAPFDPLGLAHHPDAASMLPPGAPFHLGTDLLGRDVLSRVLHGARVALVVGVGAELGAVLLGLLVGLAAGSAAGPVDAVLMRLTDVVVAVPSLVLAIGVLAVVPASGLDTVVLVLAGLGWTTIARLVRGEVRALRDRPFVVAARALGAREGRLLRRHLWPNLRAPLLAAATAGVAGNIGAEAALSFLGLGVPPPRVSWGAMLAEGQAFLTTAPWLAVVPGVALLLALFGVNLLADGLGRRGRLR